MDNELLRYIPETPVRDIIEPPRTPRFPKKQAFVFGFAAFLIAFFGGGIATSRPGDFPAGAVVEVERGETLSGVAELLDRNNVIGSQFLFKSFLIVFAGSRGLVAGDYYFKEPQGVMKVAWRLANGSYGLENVRITIPEGFNAMEIAERLEESGRFYRLDADEFRRKAARYEGYLFPDTYYLPPNLSADDVIAAMRANFERRIATLEGEIAAFKRPLADVVKMASIVEVEARTEETRRTIAGILWRRLNRGMPLQVDAAFVFVNGKRDSKLITLDDLKIDSPYNTYVTKGLPPTPISNPGLDSIAATVDPIPTKYFYYLSDDEGNMHYAVTHEEHVANKALYLK